MKKTLSLILALVLCLFLYACGNTPGPTEPPTTPPTEPSVTPPTAAEPTVVFTEPEPTVDPVRQELLDTLTSCANTLGSSHLLSRFSFSYFQDGELVILEGIDAVRWVYETALQLAPDFPEAEEIVANFTLLENKLLSMYPWYEDALGNIVDGNSTYFDYQADGSPISPKNDLYDILCPPDDYAANYGIPEYTYDGSGKLITVRYYTDETKEKIRCVIDYGYDENGFLITEHYLDADGNEFNVVYHNGENGLPVRAEGYPYNSMTGGIAYFTYDDQGRQTSICVEVDYGYQVNKQTTDYVYDDAGNLVSIRDYGHWYQAARPNTPVNYDPVYVWNYEYDESGRIIRHTYTDYGACDRDGNPVRETKPTYIVDYIYGTYYCYTPAE